MPPIFPAQPKDGRDVVTSGLRKEERQRKGERESGERDRNIVKSDRKREREERERERTREERRERPEEQRETMNRRGVDIVATNVTAATVPKPGVTISLSAFEEKRQTERERATEREKEESEK